MLTVFLIAFLIAIIFLSLFLFETITGFAFKGDYEKFNNYLTQIARKEMIYIVYHNTLSELNKTVKGDKALGLYIYSPEKLNSIQMCINNIPRIELSKEHLFGNKKSLFSLMTFAHEIGHHFSIKKNDVSESAADKYAIKLFKEVFPTWKLIFYYPIIIMYSTKH